MPEAIVEVLEQLPLPDAQKAAAPLRIEECDGAAPVCRGRRWIIHDEDLLARMVAIILVGRYWHVLSIIASGRIARPTLNRAAATEVKRRLVLAGGEAPYLRDGLIFQAISWIAANQSSVGSVIISPPHIKEAHKGFDGLQIELDLEHQQLSLLTIFEDKATEKPRKTIREQIWPELKALEDGERRHEVIQEVAVLLRARAEIDVDALLEGIIWKSHQGYRVSITAEQELFNPENVSKLFAGYDEIVVGDETRRRQAEILPLKDVRPRLEVLAAKVVKHLDEMIEDV